MAVQLNSADLLRSRYALCARLGHYFDGCTLHPFRRQVIPLCLPLHAPVGLAGGSWSAKWEVTQSSKCMHLLQRLLEVGATRRLIATHDDATTLASFSTWAGAAAPLLGGIMKTHTGSLTAVDGGSGSSRSITKAIVFSQFWVHLKLIAVHLKADGVGFLQLKRGKPLGA